MAQIIMTTSAVPEYCLECQRAPQQAPCSERFKRELAEFEEVAKESRTPIDVTSPEGEQSECLELGVDPAAVKRAETSLEALITPRSEDEIGRLEKIDFLYRVYEPEISAFCAEKCHGRHPS